MHTCKLDNCYCIFSLDLNFTTLNLDILENDILPIVHRRYLECHWTLQPICQQLFGVSNQKVYLSRCNATMHEKGNSNVIKLTLDDHLGQRQCVKS